MSLKFNVNKKTAPKILINVGSLFDIPTGSFITGAKGESIINGGLGLVTGVVGGGNNFKSSTLHYFMLTAGNRMAATSGTAMSTYDTEVNISLDRLEGMASKQKYLPENIITEDGSWSITDKSLEPADKWYDSVVKYTHEKTKDKSINVPYTAFKDPYTKDTMKAIIPTFVEIDSLSEFESEATMDTIEKSVEESNTVFMKQGLFKTKVLGSLPRLSNTSNTFFLLTAQIGEKIDMATGPAKYNQPSRKLQYLKQGDSLKGVSGKFFYLLNNAWFAHTASVLKNATTKKAEYPRDNEDNQHTDLNIVKMTQLRSKTGPSGYTLEIVVSQTEGVLPEMTEFHYIKTNGRFGLGGNDRNYFLELKPDVSMMRTTVRGKLNNDPLLRRAVNITSELSQMYMYHTHLSASWLLCSPAELYKDIKAMGYDWDILLKTRGWWTIEQYDTKVEPFLSTMDLLKMRKGEYTPYWMNDKKEVKKEYKKSLGME